MTITRKLALASLALTLPVVGQAQSAPSPVPGIFDLARTPGAMSPAPTGPRMSLKPATSRAAADRERFGRPDLSDDAARFGSRNFGLGVVLRF